MNIRRFVATDMRAALAAIRGELGPDAVMLSSRKLPEGFHLNKVLVLYFQLHK